MLRGHFRFLENTIGGKTRMAFHTCFSCKNDIPLVLYFLLQIRFVCFSHTLFGGKYAEHLLVRVARKTNLPRVARKLGPHLHRPPF